MTDIDFLRYRAAHLDRVFYALQNGYLVGDLEEIILQGYRREIAGRINNPEHSNEETGNELRSDNSET